MGNIELAELLCDDLDHVLDSTLLRFAISSTEVNHQSFRMGGGGTSFTSLSSTTQHHTIPAYLPRLYPFCFDSLVVFGSAIDTAPRIYMCSAERMPCLYACVWIGCRTTRAILKNFFRTATGWEVHVRCPPQCLLLFRSTHGNPSSGSMWSSTSLRYKRAGNSGYISHRHY